MTSAASSSSLGVVNLPLRHGGWARKARREARRTLLREEERRVSWAATVMAATAPRAGGSAPEAAASAEPPLQYSLLLQYLVGDKRQPRLLEPGSLGGIPSPAKSEEQKMIERAMESCAFKAALACVGGEAGPGAPWEAEGLGCSGVHCSEDHAPRRRGGPGPRP